eukprot:7493948-Ditylum_brightwellii.AAC.1
MELEDPKKAQQWRTVDLPEEISHCLTIQNRQHFGQTKERYSRCLPCHNTLNGQQTYPYLKWY